MGQNATLHGECTALQGALLFQWHKDEAEIIGADAQDYYIPSATFDDAGAYVLFVEDESKALWESPPFTLEVLPEGSLPAGSMLALGLLTITIAATGIRRSRPHR